MGDATLFIGLVGTMSAFILFLVLVENNWFSKTKEKIIQKFADLLFKEDEEERKKHWMWTCPTCGKKMHESCAQEHVLSHVIDRKKEEKGREGEPEKSVKGEILDDYDLDREEDEEELEIDEPESKGVERNWNWFFSRWKPVISCLDLNGEYLFHRHTHIGSVRGNDIVREFRKDLRRVQQSHEPKYSLEDLEFEFCGNGFGKIEVSK